MDRTFTIVQFLAPWQGRSGFKQFQLDLGQGCLSPQKTIKCEKVLRKAVKQIDGLILRPTWPTSRGLALINLPDNVTLFPIKGNEVDTSQPPIDTSDPSLTFSIDERFLYRRFVFRTDSSQLTYYDFAGRLVGPQRIATEIFPDTDFSPFARLIGMLMDDKAREKLLSDLEKRRFKYSRWLRRPSRKESQLTA